MSYTLSKVNKMGEMDEKYGQTYWGNVEGLQMPVMFNSMNPNVVVMSRITYEESEQKKSAKGTDYLRLKKVKIETPDGQQQTAPQPSADLSKQIAENTAQIKKINEELKRLQEGTTEKEVVLKDIDTTTEIDVSDIPF